LTKFHNFRLNRIGDEIAKEQNFLKNEAKLTRMERVRKKIVS